MADRTKAFRVRTLTRWAMYRWALLAAAGLLTCVIPSLAAHTVALAIKGYDPVAYFTDGKPTLGSPEIEYDWDEYRFRFVSVDHRELFKADPVRYAPQFANFCAMALSRGKVVEADPRYWLISEGRLYIFGEPSGPRLFREDLARHAAAANKNRPLLPKR